jgi:hypothetical protein
MANPTNLASDQFQSLDDSERTNPTSADRTLVSSETYETDMARLNEELSALRSTVRTLIGEVRESAAKTLRAAGDVVTHQGSALAATASDRAHSWASELEALARRKPLSTIAGALVAGLIIGFLGRRRS